MEAYDDSKWVEILDRLGLSKIDNYKARFLLAGKDSSFRYGMLGSDAESNKMVIMRALGRDTEAVAGGEITIMQVFLCMLSSEQSIELLCNILAHSLCCRAARQCIGHAHTHAPM